MPQTQQPPYDKPAGGWGALKGTAKHVMQNRGVLRASRTLLRVNQPDGFDCPGCAWPEPAYGHGSAFEFCENGAKAVSFETTARRVTPEFFQRHTVSELNTQTDHQLENHGRLTHPMRYDRATDRYVPIDWQDAFDLIAEKLNDLDHPDQAIFYTSGRTSNEAAFLYQLFVRAYGTNNLPDCSNMCHESSGVALTEAVGVGKGTVKLEDFDKADAIFVLGQNPGTNHPRMLTELQKAAKRGAEIVTFNPLKERGLEQFTHPQHALDMVARRRTPITSLYLQVTIGGDLAALKGLIKLVIETEDDAKKNGQPSVLDHGFIQQHTRGFDDLADDARAESWASIEKQSGLSREQLQLAADIYLKSDRVIVCWAMGLTQHRHAVATIQQAVNLMLLRGNLGRPGAGLCPVRGHSNVQGDRTMGITELPKPAFLKKLKDVFGFDPPQDHGHDVVAAIDAMLPPTQPPTPSTPSDKIARPGKVFIGMGGNFVAATPDTPRVADAMTRCDLTVHVSTKLNRSHLNHGKDALILPCLGRTEVDLQKSGPQKVSVEDSMSQVHLSHGTNPPASEHLKSEPAIVAGIALATLKSKPEIRIDWQALIDNYDLIRDKIADVLPDLFSLYNRKASKPGGFYLGNDAANLKFNTDTGKANFITSDIPDLALPKGQLKLMTLRSHDQYNTTVYDLDDRYRGVKGNRHVLFMNAEDLAARSLKDGDMLTLTSHTQEDKEKRTATGFRAIAYDIPPGCAAGYFPELNPLISRNSFAIKSRTPLSKYIPITVAATNV